MSSMSYGLLLHLATCPSKKGLSSEDGESPATFEFLILLKFPFFLPKTRPAILREVVAV